MGLFGGKDDTKQKIEELKAKMQQGQQGPPQQGGPQGWQPPQQQQAPQQQAWQQPQQQYQQPEQSWQPPQQQPSQQKPSAPTVEERSHVDVEETGIILDLGDGMSLNLPVKTRMRLDEFLQIADRVRELKRIDHGHGQQQY